MRKFFSLLPILVFALSCQNKDLIIQEAKHYTVNYDWDPWDDKVGGLAEGCIERYGRYTLDSESKILLSKAKTIELKNNSQTKVYDVSVQINISGDITYRKKHIEPTKSRLIGCDHYFTKTEGEGWIVKLSNPTLITYKIQKIELISEY